MVSIVVLGLTLFVGALAAPSQVQNRIVGGTEASTSVYPSIVQLEFHVANYYWDQTCGGNIVKVDAVLSAAYCTHPAFDWYFSPENRRIRAGADTRNTDGVVVEVASVMNHPDFNMWTLENNICIIKLASHLTYGDNINFISILAQDFVIPDNTAVVQAGWGHIANNGDFSDVLQQVTVFTVNNTLCHERYNFSTITKNMICTGLLDVGGKDACYGDYGGPLYYSGFLGGIISWGQSCADTYLPSVNTRISAYTQWIVDNA